MDVKLILCAIACVATIAACNDFGGSVPDGVLTRDDAEVDAGAAPDAGGLCGNGQIELDEACDDGNAVDGDWCESNCTPTCPWPTCDVADFTLECNVTAACEASLRRRDTDEAFKICIEVASAAACLSDRTTANAETDRILFEDLDWCSRGGAC